MNVDGKPLRKRSILMTKKCKHDFHPAPDFTESKLIKGEWRNVRIEREQCSKCGGYWSNPIHISAAERGDSINDYYGVTWGEEYRERDIYEDPIPKAKECDTY